MWLGGLDLLFKPPGKRSGRLLLRLLAVIPAAILAGAGLGVGLSGALQGTFWPQLAAAVDLRQASLFQRTRDYRPTVGKRYGCLGFSPW